MNPVKLLLFAYFRSGSSFAGDFFANSPDSFYQFEPMRAILQSIYGGWISPMDDFFFPNNTMM